MRAVTGPLALVLAASLALAPRAARAVAGPEVPPTNAEGKTVNQKGVPTDQLTPVPAAVPSKPARPAYQLYFEVDGPLLTLAVVSSIGRSIRGGLAPAYCAPVGSAMMEQSTLCDPSSLNWLDRQVAGRYHPGWGLWSDVSLYGLEALSVAGLVVDEGVRAGVNDVVVVAEATLLSSAASGISTAVTGRPRPYMYGTQAPLSVRESGDGGLSFFSGHTSTAFGAVTATFVTLHRLHPDDRWPWLVLAGGGVAAGFVGATRVLAGQHFPTDVVAGAAVGAAIGLLVPALHKAPTQLALAPLAMASGGGLSLTGPLP